MVTIFRYPGGKSRLINYLLPHLNKEHLTDAFVGGGSLPLAYAQKYPAATLHLNDLDANIFSFWHTVATGEKLSALLELVGRRPTVELFKHLRETVPETMIDKAYYAVFFNRTTFSGIATASPIGGYRQESKWAIDCRYNIDRLQKNIVAAHELLRGRTIVTNVCATEVLTNKGMYLDPPYFVKGDALYPVKFREHVTMSERLVDYKNWALSYDDAPEIRDLYKWAQIDEVSVNYTIRGKKTSGKKTNELLILPRP